MLKIPTFIIGGLLILTGLASYFFQDLGLSINLKGPFDENAKLTLTDGNETHEIDFDEGWYPSSDAAGEHAYRLIDRLNKNHAKDASHKSYYADEGKGSYKKKSFWYASSKGDTFDALLQDAKNMQNADNRNYESTPVNWAEVDVNSSTVKFVYKNEAGNSGPVTLEVSNWKNIDIETPPADNKLEFKRSWTALIPGIIGLILIGLVLGAEKKPSIRMHVMHIAVLLGLVGFIMVSWKTVGAVSEMNWLKEEPDRTARIIQASALKPAAMLTSAGLLLIFVILCIVSFIQARKAMTTTTPVRKDKTPQRKSTGEKTEDKDEKKTSTSSAKTSTKKSEKESSNTKESKPREDKNPAKNSNQKNDSKKAQSSDSTDKSPPKGAPVRKPMESATKKDPVDSKPSPPSRKTSEKDQEKKGDASSSQPKKEGEEASRGLEQKHGADKADNSAKRQDSAKGAERGTTESPRSPSPSPKETEKAPEKKGNPTSSQSERGADESKDSSEKSPEDK